MTTTLITAGLIVIKDKQLLLAFSNNKQAFYLPGGKADPGETTVDTPPGVVEVMKQLKQDGIID